MKRSFAPKQHGNCQVCGFGLDERGFCWKCSGEPIILTTVPKPAEPAAVYSKDIRQHIQRALFAAMLKDKSLAVTLCRGLEAKLPGVGWAAAADALEAMRGTSGPMSRAMLEAMEEVPF